MRRARSEPAWSILVALVASACSAPANVVPRAVSTAGDEDVFAVGDASVVVIPRPTRGRTWMSMWIDAGARDAEPAAVATLAAWTVGVRDALEARVVPDGTELHVGCESERLEACVDALVRALSARAVDESALAIAMERLRASRRGSRIDGARSADRLAMLALAGDAAGLDPLGEADDDARITAGAVEAFLAQHWGPSRALFVVIGDCDEVRARDLLARAVESAPSASSLRASRTIAPQVGARVEVGGDAYASAAIAVSDVPRALAIAERVRAELEDSAVHVFPLRGAEIVLVRGRDAEVVGAAVAYARAIAGEGSEVLAEDDPRALAARVGARWVARPGASIEGGLGIGAVIDGGRGDGTGDDPDARVAAEAGARLDALARSIDARASEEGIELDASDDRASLGDEDSARVEVRRMAIGRVALAIAIEGGARDEPARVQGRSAVLARLLARCVDEGGATPWVDPGRLGVVVEVAPARALDLVARATRCVRRLSWTSAELEDERARAIAAIDRDQVRLARAASVLAPGAPATIAPHGTRDTLAAIDARSVVGAWREMATRGRVRVAIVGEVDPMLSGRAAMLGLAGLRADPVGAAAPVRVPVAGPDILSVTSDDERVEVVVGLRDAGPRDPGDPGAAAALDALVGALDGPALRVVWARAGAGEEGAWLALALRAPEDVLATLPARLEDARQRARRALEGAIERSTRAARDARARELATARALARRLATGAREDATPNAAETARAVLDAEARFVVTRPPVLDARSSPAR